MDVTQALHSRFTCRAFKPDPVAKEIIFKIMEDANHSPSWGNTQPWKLFIASGPALERLRSAYTQHFAQGIPVNPEIERPVDWPPSLKERYQELGKMRLANLGIERDNEQGRLFNLTQNFHFFGAPAVVFLCMDRTLNPWSLFDLGLLSQSIMLAAEQYGLGSAVAVQFASYPDLVRTELGIPEDLCIAIGIALGYSDPDHLQNQVRSSRRPINDVVRFKEF
jgi:nitroreductase